MYQNPKLLFRLSTHLSLFNIFMLLIYGHFVEHIFQVSQLYFLHWDRPQCLGLLGLCYPWLIHSEWLHFGYALLTLRGIDYFKPFFTGRSCIWWNTALILSLSHYVEHSLLLGQSIFQWNFFNSPVPISIGQLFLPRIELHFIYNLIILVPMLIAIKFRNTNKEKTLVRKVY